MAKKTYFDLVATIAKCNTDKDEIRDNSNEKIADFFKEYYQDENNNIVCSLNGNTIIVKIYYESNGAQGVLLEATVDNGGNFRVVSADKVNIETLQLWENNIISILKETGYIA